MARTLPLPFKIVSGGQTGVDRGGPLDAAMAMHIQHGGWCPRGRRAEDGPIPAKYQLQATDAADYKVRTEANVLDSDGTLIICRGELRGGTQLTHTLATDHGKPCLVIDLSQFAAVSADLFRDWLSDHNIEILNVAGSRESQQPGIAEQSRDFLIDALSES